MSPISKKYRKSNTLTLSRFDQSMGAPIVLGIVFFFILCLGAADVIRSTAMIAAIFMLLVAAVRFKVLRERIHLPFLALTLYVIMDGVSTFYAVSGKFALREFLKVFLAYLLSVILLATSPKKEETAGKRLLSILVVCTALGSLVSIDLISTRWISGAVTGVLGLFTESYADVKTTLTGNRIDSIFTNSNVFAGFSGLGVILSLGLAACADKRRDRCAVLVCLFLNCLAFTLTVSIGAIFFLFIAMLVFLLLQGRENRMPMFVLLVETFLLTVISTILVMKASRGASGGASALTLLFAVLGAALLCLLDLITAKSSAWLTRIPGKVKTAVLAVVLLLIVAYVPAALLLTGDAVIAPKQHISRVLFPAPGTYTLEVDAEGDSLYLEVVSRSFQEAGANKDNLIYSGDAFNATFTIPEDSIVTYVELYSSYGITVHSARFGDNQIPLRYKLIPGFVLDRLTNRRTSNSVVQRLVYFRDGIKLFQRSPIIGLGMGAFENGIKGVQSYYYETKYAHNHYFQTLLETGIVGLILFLFLLVSSAIAIWRSRKTHPLAPALGAALIFMAGQALHDIVFSAYAYLPVAYGTFALTDLCCGEALRKPALTAKVKTASVAVISACTIVFCVFLAGNMYAKNLVEKKSTFESLEQAAKIDKFEWADYALPYVINNMGDDVSDTVRRKADAFAQRLSGVRSNTIPIYLAEYYFRTDRPEQGIGMLEQYVDYVASDPNAWQRAFTLLRGFNDGSDTIRSGAVRLAEKLERWNAENVGDIFLDEETNAFIAEMAAS